MKDMHIDVFMAATSMPQASFLELEHSPGIRFIGLPKAKLTQILSDNPGFIPGMMPKGVYKSIGEDLNTLGIVTNRKAASKERCGIGGYTLSPLCLDLNVVAPTRKVAGGNSPLNSLPMLRMSSQQAAARINAQA